MRIYNTRKSSCVNARGIPPAALQVLAMLLCLMVGGGGVPHPVMVMVGVPHPVIVGGGTLGLTPWVPPTIQTWLGYPPTIQTWLGGTPHYHPDLAGVPPTPPRPGTGYPPPPPRPGMGYPPPPPSRCGLTHKGENITFPYPLDAGGNESTASNCWNKCDSVELCTMAKTIIIPKVDAFI